MIASFLTAVWCGRRECGLKGTTVRFWQRRIKADVANLAFQVSVEQPSTNPRWFRTNASTANGSLRIAIWLVAPKLPISLSISSRSLHISRVRKSSVAAPRGGLDGWKTPLMITAVYQQPNEAATRQWIVRRDETRAAVGTDHRQHESVAAVPNVTKQQTLATALPVTRRKLAEEWA